MSITLRTFTTLICWISRFKHWPHFVSFLEQYFFLKNSDSILYRHKERSMSCMRLIFMGKGEESSITNCAVIESTWQLSPEFTCKWSLYRFCLNEISLIWGKKMLAGLEGCLRLRLILKSMSKTALEVATLCKSWSFTDFVEDREVETRSQHLIAIISGVLVRITINKSKKCSIFHRFY